MSIATYSRELKVFNVEDKYSSPITAPIRSNNPTHAKITWSGDGKWLAVAPLDRGGGGLLPIFKYSNNQLQPMSYITLPNLISASFFNWTNRNLAVGNERGEIFVWDLKDKKIAVKVEYTENHSVDLIAVNSDDMYIASGSLNSNKICLHGLKTNKVINTVCIPKSKETSSVKFCICKKNYLGISSIESVICIWDVVRSDYVFKKYQAHAGAVTDISFSPINYDVLASVSLTKTLKMHDVRESKTVLDVNIGEPLNCVDIILNGDKVALGTTGGSIIIYDLRADKILQNIKAHEGPILAIKTQNLKISKSYTEIDINTPEEVENLSKNLDISVMDVFSPITRNNAKDNSNCLLFNQSKTFPCHSTPNLLANNVIDSPNLLDDSFLKKVLSPLPQQKSMHVVSTSQLSPYLYPIKEKPDATENVEGDAKTELKKELSTAVIEIGNHKNGGGDNNMNESKYINVNQGNNDIINEIKSFQKVVLNEISLVKKEIKALREDCSAVRQLLMEDVKQEIYAGNCQSTINHSCQRLLLNELNENVLTSEEKLSAAIQLNAFRLMHIYEILREIKKIDRCNNT